MQVVFWLFCEKDSKKQEISKKVKNIFKYYPIDLIE